MMRFLVRALRAVLISLFVSAAGVAFAADDQAPDALIKSVTNEVLQIIRNDKELRSGNTRRAVELVEQKVLPNFNFTRMTQLAVGRDWRTATPEQQKLLADEFKTLLVRTYSNALTSYKDQTVEFKPFKMQPGETDVVVRSEIKQPGGQPVQLDYSLYKNDSGWKVYDVVVAGVSLVTNYREQFTQEVRNGGIDGLIKSLQKKNADLAAGGQGKGAGN